MYVTVTLHEFNVNENKTMNQHFMDTINTSGEITIWRLNVCLAVSFAAVNAPVQDNHHVASPDQSASSVWAYREPYFRHSDSWVEQHVQSVLSCLPLTGLNYFNGLFKLLSGFISAAICWVQCLAPQWHLLSTCSGTEQWIHGKHQTFPHGNETHPSYPEKWNTGFHLLQNPMCVKWNHSK